MDNLFVIGIGGTGMRCLESFVHLCAIGMFDNEEINILTIDTDEQNGNKVQTENLIDLYRRIKGENGNPNSNTFFSSQLNLYRFWTNYAGARSNYRSICQLVEGEEKRANQWVSDLFLEKDTVQEFNLSHGYRAQTHLGSHFMYHAIVEAAVNVKAGYDVKRQEQELNGFISKLNLATDAKVFVFGSVFGGTGASSIPIIPKAFQEFIKITSDGNQSINFDRIKFGATLLTEYFTFRRPTNLQKNTKENSVIADASYFALNSQAALQFYQNDPTVQRTYKRMYHIGWPITNAEFGSEDSPDKVITGGEDQKNKAHLVELLSACAAYDFFHNLKDSENKKAEYLYKAVEFKNGHFNLTFNDFVGSENKAGDIFANRLGAFFSLAHIVLTTNEGATGATGDIGIRGFIKKLEEQRITEYSTITNEDCDEINNYFKQFAYSFTGERFIPGWIYQVRNSIAPGEFMFDNRAFTTNLKELKDLDVGKLFIDNKNHWKVDGVLGRMFGNSYDTLVKTLLKTSYNESEQKVATTKEKFLAHIYNTISKLQNFIN